MVAGKMKYGIFFILLAISTGILSCKKSTAQQVQNNATLNQASNTHINVTIFVSSYPALSIAGGNAYIANAGIKGILVYRASTTVDPQFYAYERSCTYDGTTVANAKVWAQAGAFSCRDSVCGSTFNITDGAGTVSHGPATYALKAYKVVYDNSSTVTQIQIVND
jgi:Rieske Fe-S protein